MRVLVLLLLVACGGTKTDDRFKDAAVDFAQKLVTRDTAGAHAMLGKSLDVTYSRDALQAKFDEMMKDAEVKTGVQLVRTMTDWPDKQEHDAGWAYVAVGSEGLTLVIQTDGRVRSIEWGRP